MTMESEIEDLMNSARRALKGPELIPPEVPLFGSVADDEFARFRAMESVGAKVMRPRAVGSWRTPDWNEVDALKPTETFYVYSSQEFPKITARSRKARHVSERWLALHVKYKRTNPRLSQRYLRKSNAKWRECSAIEGQTVCRIVAHKIGAEIDSDAWRALSFAARTSGAMYFSKDGRNPWSPRWRGTVVTSKDFEAAKTKREVVGGCDLADRGQHPPDSRGNIESLANRLRKLIPEARVDRVSVGECVALQNRYSLWIENNAEFYAAIVVEYGGSFVDVMRLPWKLPIPEGMAPIIGWNGYYYHDSNVLHIEKPLHMAAEVSPKKFAAEYWPHKFEPDPLPEKFQLQRFVFEFDWMEELVLKHNGDFDKARFEFEVNRVLYEAPKPETLRAFVPCIHPLNFDEVIEALFFANREVKRRLADGTATPSKPVENRQAWGEGFGPGPTRD